MILHKTILILEDDLKTLTKILEKLTTVEEDQVYDFSLIILTNYLQVQKFINKTNSITPDIILLDRDCKLGGSFHVLDIERLGPDKVIAISSVPKYNEEAKARGVKRFILKDYRHLEEFSDKVAEEVAKMLKSMPILESKQHNIL